MGVGRCGIIFNMKLKIPAWRIIRLYLIMGLILGFFFYLIPGWAFPPTPTHYFVMGVWFVTTVAYATAGVFTNYYIIDKDGIIQHRFTKDYMFRFDDVIYIDHRHTIRHKTLRFVTRYGDLRYLLLDRDAQIYEAMKKRCKTLPDDEFKKLFPRIKIK